VCASCGCGMVDDDHSDDRHITLADLQQASEAADMTIEEVVANLEEAVRKVGATSMPRTPE